MSDYYNLTREEFKNLPANNLINFNNLKVKEVLIKIALCRLMGIPFVIRAIDIDDTLNKTEPLIQENLKEIDYTVTQEYFDKEIKWLHSKEKRAFIEDFYKNLDEVLEQRRVGEKRINYQNIHRPENLFPNTIKYLKQLTKESNTDKVYELFSLFKEGYDVSLEPVTFNILLTHYNPEEESIVKFRTYYDYAPGLDAIIPVRFYEADYKPDLEREMSNKAVSLIHTLGLTREEFSRCTLYENSDRVRKLWMKLGGFSVKFLPDGYPFVGPRLTPEEKEAYTLFNFERMITSIEPEWLDYVDELNRYDRSHGIKSDNYMEVDEELASKVFYKIL